MFNVKDVVLVKDLKTLLNENAVKLVEGLGDVYINKETNYAIFPGFSFFGMECTIDSIDSEDPEIPYFLSIGIWVPEFMIEKKPEPKPQKKVEPEVKIDAEMMIKDDKKAEAVQEPKVYINQFNGKPFGNLFLKLINIDPKVAEFSNTSFSRLKKHELLYIAKILKDRNVLLEDYQKLTQKELAVLCYNAVKTL